MRLHVIGDTVDRLSALRATLPPQCSVSSELLAAATLRNVEIDSVIVAADLRNPENILALKQLSARLNRMRRRLFLVEQDTRLSIAQAYALGATQVLCGAVSPAQLLAESFDAPSSPAGADQASLGTRAAAAAGVASITSMFRAVLSGTAIDLEGAKDAGRKIADSVVEHGLSDWLDSVRRHHEGTYQHCLLVTGVAIDFGMSLGLRQADMERLTTAAMVHDIGKAVVPLAILDKPGRLDADERALIETHPVAGYEALKGNAAISEQVLDAVRHHHEYLDGSGYPDGLCGNSINDIVRLLTICDIFAALIEHRPYRPIMSRQDAYDIVKCMDGKLEKPLVSAFRTVALKR
ncbi:HD domain-containing protein [Bradyrhizobium diazoefficiens]|nr:HD domain-containing phosphohydrolase [Bradyrhizobium diazoefficiens]MBR0851438.1 HD domain-containing protein [Bradyrhizobium diazoefficiens]